MARKYPPPGSRPWRLPAPKPQAHHHGYVLIRGVNDSLRHARAVPNPRLQVKVNYPVNPGRAATWRPPSLRRCSPSKSCSSGPPTQ